MYRVADSDHSSNGFAPSANGTLTADMPAVCPVTGRRAAEPAVAAVCPVTGRRAEEPTAPAVEPAVVAVCPITGLRADEPTAPTAGPVSDRRHTGRGEERGASSGPESPAAAREALLAEAEAYLVLFEEEHGLARPFERLAQIRAEIEQTGTYAQTAQELAYGARVAWRNNSRCIGRLHWETLQVRDRRHLATAEEIFEALVTHVREATNGGKIKPTITVFAPRAPGRPGIRIWNPQLIRYAGHRQPDGSIVGDPLQAELTEVVRSLGWRGGQGTPFDVLPLVIQMPGEAPTLFELPRDAVLEVQLTHPDYAWFSELGLRWHALPVVSDMRLEVGGVSYPAAPFNGWYMDTEIGVRNLGDADRYNLLPLIADRMGLDTRSDRTLWKDRALIELDAAVLHSFAAAGVSMVDHHTAARQFVRHEEKETAAGRLVPAKWSWIVPPISGSATPVWSRPYKDVRVKPNYFYQRAPWRQR